MSTILNCTCHGCQIVENNPELRPVGEDLTVAAVGDQLLRELSHSKQDKSVCTLCTHLKIFRQLSHRRRIYKEEKAKVVAAVLGTEYIQFLAALAVLLQDEIIIFFRSSLCNSSFFNIILVQIILFLIIALQNSYRGKKLTKFCPPNSSEDLCLVFCINP